MAFFQDPPENRDAYLQDRALRTELRRYLPRDVLESVTPAVAELGRHTASTLPELSEQAEANPPVHVAWGPFGRRVDEVRTHPAWEALKRFSAEHGVVATGYERALGDRNRVVQAALIHLFSASSATASCPLAMTDAAARVLLDVAPASVRERLFPQLTTREPERFITSGQWMTERTGGSDVGDSETVARFLGREGEEERYALYGTKWFTSAVTSEMALTLARIEDAQGGSVEGSRGLTLFCVDVRKKPEGGYQGILVNRLKDKLGTRALPTAELTLDGAPAVRLGEVGKGVKNISTMLNITRWYNAVASASGMARCTWLARDYAEKRAAFGRRLIDHPLHARTLDDMEAETAAATALCFAVADLLGRMEQGTLDDAELSRLRGLIPIAKLTCGKQAVAVASEALEAFGGAGYIEDTGLPRLLRDAQVLSIWEGTTNVLSLDVLRAEARSGSLGALLKDLGARAERLPEGLDGKAVGFVRETLGRLVTRAKELAKAGDPEAMEREARRMALTTGYVVEAVLLAESVAHAGADDDEAGLRFARFCLARLAAPLS